MRLPVAVFAVPLLAAALAAFALAQSPLPPGGSAPPHEEFKNLKVLAKDIPPGELRAQMSAFTRALGVRCAYCHVGEEGKPLRREDFPRDDKPTKLKAREMMKMTRDINEKYLATLEHRVDPPLHVECATCHRGSPQPRMLQDVLASAYGTGGLDSTLARYHALRDRYYGRATYDFGEVPLADVAGKLVEGGHAADAESLLAFNVAMNPASAFAKRQYAFTAIMTAFGSGAANGPSAVRSMRDRYGEALVSEQMVGAVARELLARHEEAAALAAYRQNAADYPASSGAFEDLGGALMETGDLKHAKEALAKAIALDPANQGAKDKLDSLKHGSRGKPKSGG